MNTINEVAFYVVQNSDGQYFRRKGYQGSGKTWVDGLATARVWTKISGARATVTFFANNYPGFPPPKIIKLNISSTEIIDETDRIEKAKKKKAESTMKRAMWQSKQKLQQAERELQEAKERYEREKGRLRGK